MFADVVTKLEEQKAEVERQLKAQSRQMKVIRKLFVRFQTLSLGNCVYCLTSTQSNYEHVKLHKRLPTFVTYFNTNHMCAIYKQIAVTRIKFVVNIVKINAVISGEESEPQT